MKNPIQDNLQMKVRGQFCVNSKTVRIMDIVFSNILTTVRCLHLLWYLTSTALCSPQDLPSFCICIQIIAVYFSAFR